MGTEIVAKRTNCTCIRISAGPGIEEAMSALNQREPNAHTVCKVRPHEALWPHVQISGCNGQKGSAVVANGVVVRFGVEDETS